MTMVCLPGFSQQAANAACPSDQPGVYVQDASGWHQLAVATPAKMKAKHAFLSSMSYGAVSAPAIVEYARAHAGVQVQGLRPAVCVSHIMAPGQPLLVRLHEKKNTRELDSGSLRAVPFANDTVQAHAAQNSVVPTTTSTQDGITLLTPQNDLGPGEYAVMFGAQNMAILDFGIQLGSQK